MVAKRQKRGTAEIVLGLLLIAAALFWTIRNVWEARMAQRASESALFHLERLMSGEEREPGTPEVSDEVEYPDYVLDEERVMQSREVEGIAYIATLRIPALGLSLPVAETWDYETLRSAPCRYMGSAYRHDMVIAGHNYTGHFGRLYMLSAGDEVLLTDLDGNRFQYEVAEILTLPSGAVEEMTESAYDLTLFTCTPGGRDRVTVRCRSVGGESQR